ncbi:hypothetical protein AAG747_05650 [Rapidithrix thailandica]|uniref:Uncharacterized protein n=1 Tax=Rapidithrix thailandica TaxID=413964 RepID=A0AAW9S4P1_9BACT
MDWTGKFYGFYSDKPIEEVFRELKNQAYTMGYQYDLIQEEDGESLFFYKNQEMLDYQLEHGYNTDLHDQGCFSVEAKLTKLKGIATLFEFEGRSNFEPLDINLMLHIVYYYNLVIPDFIEDSVFSKKIHNIFSEILLKE